MEIVLEELITKGRPWGQKEVGFGLADLSIHEELHDKIV